MDVEQVLAEVNAELLSIEEKLVTLQEEFPACAASLESVAAKLQELSRCRDLPLHAPGLAKLIASTMAHAHRVQALFESAAQFHFGWAACALVKPNEYGADGMTPSSISAERSGMCVLEA
jgi:hypothetical protein